MIYNMILQNILYIGVLILTSFIIYISKKGSLGIKMQNFFNTNSFSDILLLLFIIGGAITLILQLLLVIIHYLLLSSRVDLLLNVTSNEQDPIRWWPTTITITITILGIAVALYRTVSGNTITKPMAALGILTFSIPFSVFFYAVENPNGFYSIMLSWMKYKETGQWPSNIATHVPDKDLECITYNTLSESVLLNNHVSISSLLPTDPFSSINQLLDKFNFDSILSYILAIFRPVAVEGHLDDLIGQQLFIHFLLISVVFGLILILSVYIFINIFIHNKDYILKRFNNKFILLYIKYQLVLAKISMFLLPLLLMFGLLELLVGLHFLITHPIPFEKLPIDLHTYIDKK